MYDTESRVKELVEATLNSLGYNIVLIKLSGSNYKTLQLLIEKINEENIGVADCKIVSNHVSAMLDAEDIIKDKYFLEVSSPGIERPLIKKSDFERFAGKVIIVKLKQAQNMRKSFKGKLLGVEGENILILDQETKQEEVIDFENIKNSNIVLTNELYKEILNKAKSS